MSDAPREAARFASLLGAGGNVTLTKREAGKPSPSVLREAPKRRKTDEKGERRKDIRDNLLEWDRSVTEGDWESR